MFLYIQIFSRDPRSFSYKMQGYFSNSWNRLDFAIFFMFVISIILRYTLNESNFVWARMFYALTLAMFFLRFMQVFFVNKNIGPKVIMIRRMVSISVSSIKG